MLELNLIKRGVNSTSLASSLAVDDGLARAVHVEVGDDNVGRVDGDVDSRA